MEQEQAPGTHDPSLLDKQLNRRKFLTGAASQITKHALITVPAVTVVLSGAAVPANAQRAYGSGTTRTFLESLGSAFIFLITPRDPNRPPSGDTGGGVNAIRG